MIVVRDENEEAEGSLVMAASQASPKNVAFMVKHGSGIVSVGMKGEDLERLNIPLMSPENEDDVSAPFFTVSVVILLATVACLWSINDFLINNATKFVNLNGFILALSVTRCILQKFDNY